MNADMVFERIGGTLKNPKNMFPKILSEGFELKEVFLILGVLYITKALLNVATSKETYFFGLEFFQGVVSKSMIPVFVVWILLHTLFKWSSWSYISHLISRAAFKGSGNFTQCFVLFGYSRIVEVLVAFGMTFEILNSNFSIFTLVLSVVAFFWGFYLKVRALMEIHGLDYFQGIFVVLASGIFMWIPVLFLDFVVVAFMFLGGVF